MAEVVLVRWPEQGVEAARLRRSGVALLYLVGAEDDPPAPADCLEDWVRSPADDRDLRARVAALEQRAATHLAPPAVDADGTLRYRGKVVALPPTEARMASLLAARFCDTVEDGELESATLEADGADGDATVPLRVHIARLRARVRQADLSVRRSGARGYRLQPA